MADLDVAGVTLLALPLRVEHDLVLLRRQTRSLCEELGFEERAIRSLSAAAYEASRILFAESGRAAATLRLNATSLDIALTAASGDPGLATRLQRLLEGLSALARVAVEAGREEVTILLSAPRPGHQEPETDTLPLKTSFSADLEESQDALRQRVNDLLLELDETNRGVLALYAELDDQAERLRQAEDRFKVLLDSVQDYAICMLDPSGDVVSWNSGAERLFGYTTDEIVGRHVRCFYPPSERDLGLPEQHLQEVLDQGRFESEGLRVRRGGSSFDAHVVLATVRSVTGALRGFSLVVRDTTSRKRLEDDLRRRADELAAANRAKEEFLATLSHELRTPLNAMLGWTRLLRMDKLEGAAMRRALETIERNAHIQEQLIADILDVSRIVTGRLRLTLRAMDLGPIIEASLDAVRPAADAKGVALSGDTRFTGPVLGDPDRLQQVVWNLLANAIKFTPSGGRVSLTVSRVGPHAVMTVTDTGEGIAPELLPFIFDRFRQGDASSTRPHGGLGLGLSIVRHIVELHGGQVYAFSEGHARGATFSVHLPVRAIQGVDPPRQQAATPLDGIKVLVVDDDADAREVVATALAHCGALTAAASSTFEALELLAEFRPHVLVSDLGMPNEDGYSLIRRIREQPDETIANLPAVALTGFVHAEERRRALNAGYQRFVAKPVEVDELAAVVRTLVPPTAESGPAPGV